MEDTYTRIKKTYQRETIVLSVLYVFIGLVFLSAFREAEAPADSIDLIFMSVIGAVVALFILSGIIGAIIRTTRWKKMLESLSCFSDEDAQWMMSHAKPLDIPISPYIVPHFYIKEDRLINFTTAKTYEIRTICRIKKKVYTKTNSLRKNFGIEIKLNCSPHCDKVTLHSREEMDMIYDKIISVFERYGGDVRKL